MPLYQDDEIAVYFGDSYDQLFMTETQYNLFQKSPVLLKLEQFKQLRNSLAMKHLMFARQVHGTSGFLIDVQTINSVKPFSIFGDYLITNALGIGIGILTADCLPIVLYDKKHRAIATIHAGWRGSVAGIAAQALEHLNKAFGTMSTDVRVLFGPSAGPCCYNVGPEVLEAVKPYQKQVLEARNNQVYFDLVRYNQLLLESAGVPPSAFCADYAQCTICNDQFWSYRRQQKDAGRQMTVICLK